jgi:hypothetical protein
MKTLHTFIAVAAAAVFSAGAMAQPHGTDEARELAAQATHQAALEQAFEAPAIERVVAWDYRGAAANEARIAQFVGFHRHLQAHMNGVRAVPVSVVSEDTARAAASQKQIAQDMDSRAAYLKASPTAWAVHQDVVEELGLLAQR